MLATRWFAGSDNFGLFSTNNAWVLSCCCVWRRSMVLKFEPIRSIAILLATSPELCPPMPSATMNKPSLPSTKKLSSLFERIRPAFDCAANCSVISCLKPLYRLKFQRHSGNAHQDSFQEPCLLSSQGCQARTGSTFSGQHVFRLLFYREAPL